MTLALAPATYAQRALDLEKRMTAGLTAMARSAKDTPHEALVQAAALRVATAARRARARAMTGKITSPQLTYYSRIDESRAAAAEVNRTIAEQRTECEDDAAAEALRRAFYARSQAMGSDVAYGDIERMAAEWRAEVEAFRMQHVCGVECGGLGCEDGEAVG